jgi:CRP-like cAMP-binding protein
MAESRFLNALPADLHALMRPDLRPVVLKRDDVLLRAGEVMDFVYFPTTGLVSMVVSLENGSTIEATTIGNDGFSGLSAFLGRQRADATCMVQIAGDGLRMPVDRFLSHLEDRRLHEHVGAFAAKTFATIAQSTACIAFHPVQERLARWLLMVRDGTEQDEFELTHDFLAVMLGVHRPTVTIAIRILESAGLINHGRGHIRVLDADGLKLAACECYRLPRTPWAISSPDPKK